MLKVNRIAVAARYLQGSNLAYKMLSRSGQLEVAVPVSIISSLSPGEFVGIVTDNPDGPIELKTFHARLVNGHNAIEKADTYEEIPALRKIDDRTI